jgi:hypothetical protein
VFSCVEVMGGTTDSVAETILSTGFGSCCIGFTDSSIFFGVAFDDFLFRIFKKNHITIKRMTTAINSIINNTPNVTAH